MKKRTKKIIIVSVLSVLVLSIIFSTVDHFRISANKDPIFAIRVDEKTRVGLFYKVYKQPCGVMVPWWTSENTAFDSDAWGNPLKVFHFYGCK